MVTSFYRKVGRLKSNWGLHEMHQSTKLFNQVTPWTTWWFRIPFWKWREVAQYYVKKFKYENSRLLWIVHSHLLFTCLNTKPILTFSRMMIFHLERLKARNMCKIFSLIPSKRPVTRENWDKLFCQITKCQMAFFGITMYTPGGFVWGDRPFYLVKWPQEGMADTHEYWSKHGAQLLYLSIFHGLNLIIFS